MHVTWMQRRQRQEQAQTAQPLPAGAAQSSQTYKRTVEGPAGNVHSLRRTWRRREARTLTRRVAVGAEGEAIEIARM